MPVPDEPKGVYDKFRILRTDGKSEFGKKHWGCRYFVLDLDHDPHAVAALRAYAESCSESHPELACDLEYTVERLQDQEPDPIFGMDLGFKKGHVWDDGYDWIPA